MNHKKQPLATHYCDFILFLKSKDEKKIKEIVKNLPEDVINALSEVVLNGLCGNIPLNSIDIEKLEPFRKLMNLLSNKSVGIVKRKRLMSSVYASRSFCCREVEVHGLMSLQLPNFKRRSSMQMMNRYPAMGSPCLHPLPALILGVGYPFMRIDDWKSLRREFIQEM